MSTLIQLAEPRIKLGLLAVFTEIPQFNHCAVRLDQNIELALSKNSRGTYKQQVGPHLKNG